MRSNLLVDQKTRLCSEETCSTVLSIYNKKDHCFVHRAPKFPRVRGYRTDDPRWHPIRKEDIL